MPSPTGTLYGQALSKAFNGEINWLTGTIKVMACTATYVPDQDAHVYKSSVSNEVVATGYTARGITLTSKTNTYTAATNLTMLDAADISWSAAMAARYLVVYQDTGSDATSPLIGYVDAGSTQTSTTTWQTAWDAAGIFNFTAA